MCSSVIIWQIQRNVGIIRPVRTQLPQTQAQHQQPHQPQRNKINHPQHPPLFPKTDRNPRKGGNDGNIKIKQGHIFPHRFGQINYGRIGPHYPVDSSNTCRMLSKTRPWKIRSWLQQYFGSVVPTPKGRIGLIWNSVDRYTLYKQSSRSYTDNYGYNIALLFCIHTWW